MATPSDSLRDSAVAQLLLTRYTQPPRTTSISETAMTSSSSNEDMVIQSDTAMDLSASASKVVSTTQIGVGINAQMKYNQTFPLDIHSPNESANGSYQHQNSGNVNRLIGTVTAAQGDMFDVNPSLSSHNMQRFITSKRFRAERQCAPYDPKPSKDTDTHSPNLRALLRKFDENNRERFIHENSRSVLHDYLQSTRADTKQHKQTKHRRAHFSKPSATISSPTQLAANTTSNFDPLVHNSGVIGTEQTNLATVPIEYQHPHSSVASIPPLAMIGEVVDKQFDVQRSRQNQNADTCSDPIWIKEEPDWEITGAQLQDPKAAYILQNLRAGIREQQHRAKSEARDEDRDIVIMSTNLKNKEQPSSEPDELVQTTDSDSNIISHGENPDTDSTLYDNAKPNHDNIDTSISTDNMVSRENDRACSLKDTGIQCVLLTDQSGTNIMSSGNDVTTTSSTSQPSCVITEAQEGISLDSRDNTCTHCNINFNDPVLHSIHMGCHNLNASFLCNICGIQCSDKYAFYTHIMRGHNSS